MRPEPVRKVPRKTASFSKANPPMSSKAGRVFPAFAGPPEREKPPESGGFLAFAGISRGAVRAARGRPAARSAVALGPRSRSKPRSRRRRRRGPSSRSKPRWRQPRSPKRRSIRVRIGEAALLAVVEGLVERIGGIGDLLHRRGGGRHASARSRRRATGSAGFWRSRLSSRIAFIRALARSIRSLANSRTAVSTGGHSFSWSGVELQPGMDGRDPRVGEGRPVLGAHAHVTVVTR